MTLRMRAALSRVFQDVGREQRVAQRFHVDGGVVLIAVDRVQIEQRERDLVLDDAQVGAILRAHPPRVQFAQTRLKALVKAPLLVQALRTHIVQEIVQMAPSILMQSHAGRSRRREGERGENKLVGETREVLGRLAATAPRGHQNKSNQCSNFRHCCNCSSTRPSGRRPSGHPAPAGFSRGFEFRRLAVVDLGFTPSGSDALCVFWLRNRGLHARDN